MCGMCGIVSLGDKSPDVAVVRAMTGLLAHRGPDDGDVVVCHEEAAERSRICMGHRPLSIIDLSSRARQPMSYDKLTIVYNGESYNFVELRQQLQRVGHQFLTRSDTEVILHAYREWGLSCLHRKV